MDFPWTAPDGLALPGMCWRPAGEPRGVIVCVHGLGGAAADFIRVGEALSPAGFAVFAPNLRGQGMDPRTSHRGGEIDLPRLADDIEAFIEATMSGHPGAPLFLIGESMGSLILAWMLVNRPAIARMCGVVFSVPVVVLKRPTPWPVRKMVTFLAAVTPGLRFYPSWFVSGKHEQLRVTRDEEHLAYIRRAPHRVEAFTFGALNSLGNLMESSDELAKSLTAPCLVLAAGRDVYLRGDQVRSWFGQIAARDKTFRLYPEGYHLLWNDLDRETVLADIRGWVEARLVPVST